MHDINTNNRFFPSGVSPFNYSSYQYHHSNNLKVSKMSPTPQTVCGA